MIKITHQRLWIAVITGLVTLTGLLAGVKAMQIGAMIQAGKSFKPPPEAVTTATVESAEWQSMLPAIGTLVAVHSVTVASELPGMVRFIGFDSGDAVRRGAELVKLDTSVEEAQLAAAQADAILANQSLERARNLRRAGSNTQAELDAAEARGKQALANVDILQATIAKKTIRAPFNGLLGIRKVELGQVLSAGAMLASLQSVDPIYAEFLMPQQALAKLRQGMKTRLRTDSFPGSTWNGRVSTVDSEVDVATRNVRLRALFENPDGRLRAGMYVTVEVLTDGSRPVLLIPATAVIYAPFGDSVYVVQKPEGAEATAPGVVHQQFVRLGERRGDLVAVDSGLEAGRSVVSSGAFKLRNGMSVLVNNDLAPAAELAPHPTDK